MRNLFACLFSGTLEFNNMFASYKGEGTGAVRHMFYHHILKPERAPLEANVWGTPRSSGSFSTLFESRILRALRYNRDPFEIRAVKNNGKMSTEKVFGLSDPLEHDSAATFDEFRAGRALYLSCGDSSSTDLESESVDAVVTDPPFFDNVHYSQLADFFHVWQRFVLGSNGHRALNSTRSELEVQHSDASAFAARLQAVWTECHRVLKPDGLLVFTYHHSRNEGWRCVLEAIMNARLRVVACHPIKSEMSVAAPKHLANEPIDLDIILVCRKRDVAARSKAVANMGGTIVATTKEQLQRLNGTLSRLSRNDVRIVLMAQLLKELSSLPTAEKALAFLDTSGQLIEASIDEIREARSSGPPVSCPAEH